MIYLIQGEDTQAKDLKINEIKAKYLKNSDALQFDFQTLHAPKLDHAILKKALIDLPVLSEKRIVLLRVAQKLDMHHKDLIWAFAQSKEERMVLILDYDKMESTNVFAAKLKSYAEIISFQKEKPKDAFDVTNALQRKDAAEALKNLSELYAQGQHPLQIMGAIVWFWGKNRLRVSPAKFKEGLLALAEADLNIKRSRVDSEQAVEILIAKLVSCS